MPTVPTASPARKLSQRSVAYWSGVTCSDCGLAYRDFRPGLMSWSDVQVELWLESERARAKGDYSRRVTRRRILGRLFETKQLAWRQHIDWCEHEQGSQVAGEPSSHAPFLSASCSSSAPASGERKGWKGACR